MSDTKWYLPTHERVIDRNKYRGIGRPKKSDYEIVKIKYTKWESPFEDLKFQKVGDDWKYTFKVRAKLPKIYGSSGTAN